MKAMLKDRVIAPSDDVLEYDNYHYFRRADVRMEWSKVSKGDVVDVRPGKVV